MTIIELAEKTGDARLMEYHFANGALVLRLSLYEDDRDVTLQVVTDIVMGKPFAADDSIRSSGHLEIVDLLGRLRTEKGYYVPSSDFGSLMQEAREGFAIAYGKKTSEYRYLLSFRGADRIVSALSRDLEHVVVSFDRLSGSG